MKNKAIVFTFLISSFTAYAMTEYEIMSTKNSYAQNLKALVYSEASFKKQFRDYAEFLKQVNEKDLYIVNALEQHFKQVMEQDRIEFDKAQNDLNAWQESIRNEYFLRDMDKGSVLSGIASCGLSACMGYLVICVFRQSQLTDADGLIGGLLTSIGLFAGIGGAALVKEGWNYNKNHTRTLQDELAAIKERIKASSLNYAYMTNNKDTLSNQ